MDILLTGLALLVLFSVFASHGLMAGLSVMIVGGLVEIIYLTFFDGRKT